MKFKFRTLAVAFVILNGTQRIFAQGTVFSYQGQLESKGNPANGTYNLQFTLYNNSAGSGTAVAGPVTDNGILVTNGLFTVELDFGGVWNSATNWLQIGVETNGATPFATLTPLQKVTPIPQAIFAETASNLTGTLPASSLSGTYGGAVTLNNADNSFTGSGAGLTSVNASTLDGLGGADFWQLTGNAGTTPGVNFVGTTDDEPLELHVNDTRALELAPGASDAPNLVGGFYGNIIDSGLNGAVIAGGGTANFLGQSSPNHVSANYSSIGGGSGNWIQSGVDHSIIGCGYNNTIQSSANDSVISGGINNSVGAPNAVICGGFANVVSGAGSLIGGGGFDGATLNGNQIQANAAAIADGLGNNILSGGDYSFIGGGYENNISGIASFIGGGGYDGEILDGNQIQADAATIGGGLENSISWRGDYSFIGGGNDNSIRQGANGSVICGGQYNVIQTNVLDSIIDGGYENSIQLNAYMSVLGGGFNNSIQQSASYVALGGGYQNSVQAAYCVLGGGIYNTIQPNAGNSVLAGGNQNTIQLGAGSGVISGGYMNAVGGESATVPGGSGNEANGMDSFAAGTEAQAINQGAFVWADDAQANTPFPSVANNEFAVRATGGVRFVSAIGETGNPTAGVSLAPGNTSWGTISDRYQKKNFAPVDCEQILDKLARVPMEQWNYKWESDNAVPNIGPMAQDFVGAFYPGRNDKVITTLEFDGVELAAIQGLNQKLNEKDAVIQQQAADIMELKARLAKIEQMINSRNGVAQ
ncbi:MAG TPA: tail fiber domain-containing protein [Alphaproteobacteria bacterium]|nr:tail fiber domain-containing protein [Alphaproteobacteria bacterium]